MVTSRQTWTARLGRQGWFLALALSGAMVSAQLTTPIRLPAPRAGAEVDGQAQPVEALPPAAAATAEPAAATAAATSSAVVAATSSSEPSAVVAPGAAGATPGGDSGLGRLAGGLRNLSQACQAAAADAGGVPATPAPGGVPAVPAPGGSEAVKRVTVADVGIEVLRVLSEHGLAPELSEAAQDEFVRGLLVLTGTRAILEDTLPAVIGPGESRAGGCEKSVIGAGNDFVLLRVWLVDAACVEQLRRLQPEVRQAKSKGVVLSLLGGSGADPAAAAAFAAVVREMALPVVVLVDHMTNGSAEALAGQLRQNGALLIGEKTHGLPGPTQVVTLLGGHRLLVPAAAVAGATAAKLQPDLLLGKDEMSGPHDIPPSWLEQAMDFLAVVNALE